MAPENNVQGKKVLVIPRNHLEGAADRRGIYETHVGGGRMNNKPDSFMADLIQNRYHLFDKPDYSSIRKK